MAACPCGGFQMVVMLMLGGASGAQLGMAHMQEPHSCASVQTTKPGFHHWTEKDLHTKETPQKQS